MGFFRSVFRFFVCLGFLFAWLLPYILIDNAMNPEDEHVNPMTIFEWLELCWLLGSLWVIYAVGNYFGKRDHQRLHNEIFNMVESGDIPKK